jgi:hypothetical protein
MDFEYLCSQMQTHADAIGCLAGGIPEEQAPWKPAPDSWSILEVVNHLYDEECLDFRVRLDLLLRRSDEDWPPIDPVKWVVEREYNRRDLAESVANFLDERERSLAWLHSLESPDWTASIKAPWGEISAGDMFTAWAAHDVLHLRQLVELHWALTGAMAAPHRVDYAGDW